MNPQRANEVIGRRAVRASIALALIALAACGSAVAVPQLGTEFTVGSVPAPAPLNQERPAVAAGPGGYLLVWQDRRNGNDYDIYGTLLDAQGKPMSADSILISAALGGAGAHNDQLDPAVSYGSGCYMVVWEDRRLGNAFPHIYGSRVTTSGQVLDPLGAEISGSSANQSAPCIASNGSSWEVAWENASGTVLTIWGAKVSIVGNNLSVTGKQSLETGGTNPTVPAIAWNGGNYQLVWEDERASATADDIYGCLVSSSGAPVSLETLISNAPGAPDTGASGTQTVPSVQAGSGGQCLVVWQDKRGATEDIYGTRVTSAGTVQDVGGIAISLATGDQEYPVVCWETGASSNYVVAWRDKGSSRKIRGSTVSTYGVVSGAFDIFGSATGLYGACVAGGTNCYLVATYTLMSPTDIYCRLMPDGAAMLASLSVQDQPTYAAAFNGSNFVAVWADKRTGMGTIYGARISADGTVWDAGGGVMLTNSGLNEAEPAIAWDGTNFLVVWSEQSPETGWDIKGQRIDNNLQKVGSVINISSAQEDQQAPDIAFNGTYYLVAWQDSRSVDFTDIYGVRVSKTGTLYSLSGPICTSDNDQYNPCVTTNGSDFLVAWEDNVLGWPQIYCGRVSSAGVVLDGAGKQVTTTYTTQYAPDAAFDGTRYLIAFTDYRNGGAGDIYGAFVSTAGVPNATDFGICTGSAGQANPAIAWTGSNYYVAWEDTRNISTTTTDIYATRVGSDGSITDPGGFLLSGATYPELGPVLVPMRPDLVTAFYCDLVADAHRLAGRACGGVLPISAGSAKAKPENTVVALVGLAVTAGNDQLSGCFYTEELNRSSGIKVTGGGAVHEGDRVNVVGPIVTVGCERQVSATTVEVKLTGAAVPGPAGLPVRSLGGGGFFYDQGAGTGQPGVAGGFGLNNIGLLVRVTGKVLVDGSDYYLTDEPTAGPTAPKAKLVIPAGVTPPQANWFVAVTGISSCETSDSGAIRRILVRKNSDILRYR